MRVATWTTEIYASMVGSGRKYVKQKLSQKKPHFSWFLSKVQHLLHIFEGLLKIAHLIFYPRFDCSVSSMSHALFYIYIMQCIFHPQFFSDKFKIGVIFNRQSQKYFGFNTNVDRCKIHKMHLNNSTQSNKSMHYSAISRLIEYNMHFVYLNISIHCIRNIKLMITELSRKSIEFISTN